MALLFFKLDQKCLSWHYKKEKTTLGGDRTLDHKIKSLALYHLSYEGRLAKLSSSSYLSVIFKKYKKKSPRWDSNPRPQAYEACAITTMLHGHKSRWRDSNSRPPAYKAGAITTMLHRLMTVRLFFHHSDLHPVH